MRLSEVAPGLSIDLEAVEAVKYLTAVESEIVIAGQTYTALLPYDAVVALIGNKTISSVQAMERTIRTSVEPARALEQLARYQATPTP